MYRLQRVHPPCQFLLMLVRKTFLEGTHKVHRLIASSRLDTACTSKSLSLTLPWKRGD